MAELIQCKIQVDKVFYPKHASRKRPGFWASFTAQIIDLELGTPKRNRYGRLRVSGQVPSLHKGQIYSLTAQLSMRQEYGPQYEVLCMNEQVDFQDPVQQRQFLEHILTDHQVNTLYEQLEDPFDAIRTGNIQALCTVNGIGEKTAGKLIESYSLNIDNGNAYVQLDAYGLTKTMVDKLVEHYKSADTLVDRIRTNPYMIMEVDGFSWRRTDEMALHAGLDPQSVTRTAAFVEYYLHREATAGSTWIPVNSLATACVAELGLQDANTLRQALYQLNDAGKLWWDDQKTLLALTSLRTLEQQIAEELHRIASAPVHIPCGNLQAVLDAQQTQQGIFYTQEQIEAIHLVLQNSVSIITGYGGTGKSTVVAAVLKVLGTTNFAQTALSGRAAARLTEITAEDGYTIHRLLQYDFKSKTFKFNKDNPLDKQVIVLDEISMVGAELFLSLLQAIPSGCRLIMIGDDGQLESIGLCNIFRDMLASQVIPVARLTTIHRQAARSAIITESIRVRTAHQLVPHTWTGTETRGELQDLELDIYADAALSQSRILEHYKMLCRQGATADTIQVVLPQKSRGDICTSKINNLLQRVGNPHGANEIYLAATSAIPYDYCLRENDKVIISHNHYDTEAPDKTSRPIFNGNRGTIHSISSNQILIDFDQWGPVVIPRGYWHDIELAYALTCHKLQGSEADYVIIGLDYSARTMLTREWLYTAITRAKKRCVLCAQNAALSYAIANSNLPYKRTFLVPFLQQQFDDESPGRSNASL